VQDLDFHDQFANAPLGVVELPSDRIVLALLEARIHPGQRPIPPLFELVDRHGDFPRDGIHRLAAQQTQDHFLLPSGRPALNVGGRAGFLFSRVTRSFQRPRRNPLPLLSLSAFPTPFSDTVLPQIRVQINRGRFIQCLTELALLLLKLGLLRLQPTPQPVELIGQKDNRYHHAGS
jgi:hypothetical protein